MVRLKGIAFKVVGKTESTFQFHYGTIKSPSLVLQRVLQAYFNSTMVRLKVFTPFTFPISVELFQFHYGTIKSNIPNNLFQSSFYISIPLWYD